MAAALCVEDPGRLSAFTVEECPVEKCTLTHDLEKVTEVVNAAFKKHLWLAKDRTSIEHLKQILSDPDERLYVLISPTKDVCGTACIMHQPDGAELTLFSIHPDYQRLKLGPFLLKHSEKMAVEVFHAKKMTLMTIGENLVKFYQAHGYELIDTIPLPEVDIIQEEFRGQRIDRVMTKPL